jgi:hypothetical protein
MEESYVGSYSPKNNIPTYRERRENAIWDEIDAQKHKGRSWSTSTRTDTETSHNG